MKFISLARLAKQDGRRYKRKMGLAGNTLPPPPNSDQKVHMHSSRHRPFVLQETLEFGKLVVSILWIHDYPVSKGCFIFQIRRKIWWTAASHDHVLITYCCEGNSMRQCLDVVEGLWHQALLASCIMVGPGVMVWKTFT